jgi:hypothetical protein
VAVTRPAGDDAVVALPFGLSLPGEGAILTASAPWDGIPGAIAGVVPKGPGWSVGTMDVGAYPAEPATLSFRPLVPFRAEERAQPARVILRPGSPW